MLCLLAEASRSANVTCLSPPFTSVLTTEAAAEPSWLSADDFSAGLAGVTLYPNIISICSAATRFASFLFVPTPVHTLSPTVTWTVLTATVMGKSQSRMAFKMQFEHCLGVIRQFNHVGWWWWWFRENSVTMSITVEQCSAATCLRFAGNFYNVVVNFIPLSSGERILIID